MATKKAIQHNAPECRLRIMPVRDALEVLNGKWKILIMISITFGPKRFRQISKEVEGITDRMLSKELKDLEMNQLIERKVYDSFPPTVEYSITAHGKSLKKVIDSLHRWGVSHRQKITGKK